MITSFLLVFCDAAETHELKGSRYLHKIRGMAWILVLETRREYVHVGSAPASRQLLLRCSNTHHPWRALAGEGL